MGSCPSDQKSAVTVGTSGQNDDLSSGVTILACEVQGYLVVPDEATRKEAEEEEARNFHEKATAEKAAATASPESALTPLEQLALAEKEEDYDLCERLAPFVDQYLAAEAQLGVAKAAKDYAQAKKAKKLLEMSFGEWTTAEERKAEAAREKVAAEKAAAEKAAAVAFAAVAAEKAAVEKAAAAVLSTVAAEKAAAEKAAAAVLAAGNMRKARGKELSTLLVENHGQKHGRAAEVRAKALDLISKGADLTVVDEDDITPLHRAANWDHPDCIGPMLKAGAQLEAKDYFGSTPLHKAALYGRLDCVGLLLKAGAEPGAKDDDGRTARDEAVQYKNNQWRAVVELLDEHAVRT